MPFQNNYRTLPSVLVGLLNLDYPKKNLRLLFVDGGAKDGSRQILEEFRSANLTDYGDIMIGEGEEFASLPRSRNYCIENLRTAEMLWLLDSDVVVTRDSLRLLLRMKENYDIASLYYTHNREEDPPQATGIGPVRAVRTGCTLITPKTIQTVGKFNEKLIHEIEDADYCLRAGRAGLRVGFDEIHEQKHLKFGSGDPWYHPIELTWIRRRSRSWWFANRTFEMRYAAYCCLFGLLLFTPISPLFALPVLAFFVYQLVRGVKPKKALARTLVALIVPPTTIYSFLELNLWHTRSANPKEIDPAFK